KLVIDNLQTFSARVICGLDQADWQTRRQIITTLIKRVEMEPEQVKIVYRVELSPFDRRPEKGVLQHCKGRQRASFARRDGGPVAKMQSAVVRAKQGGRMA